MRPRLSSGMPIPVSMTANATTESAWLSTSWSPLQPAEAGSILRTTSPSSVNLQRVGQEVLEDLVEALLIGGHGLGQAVARLDAEPEALLLRDLAEGPLDELPHFVEGEFADLDQYGPGFDLGHVEDVADQGQQVRAGGVDALGELDLLRRQVALGVVGEHLGQDQQAVQRGAELVRHVGQELRLVPARSAPAARPSPAGTAAPARSRDSWPRPPPSAWRAAPPSPPAPRWSAGAARSASSAAPRIPGANRPASPAARWISRSSSCWLCSSPARVWDCLSSSSVRMLVAMVLSTMPMLSASWSRKVRWISVKRWKEASSSTALTSSSNRTGSTTRLRGGAPPRPEMMCV